MKLEVTKAIEELQRQFGSATFTVRDDSQGGGYVLMDGMCLGERFKPERTWVGFHITPQYPYADIYPVFIGAEVTRVDGKPFSAPVTPGHQFEGRSALQVSRRSGTAQNGLQKATGKILKILDFLEKMP